MFRGGLAIAAFAACAPVPDREAEQVRFPELSVDGTTVYGGGFALTFADSGVRMPTSLIVEDIEMLAAPACPNPVKVGISLEQLQIIAAGQTSVSPDQDRLDVTLRGPAVAQVEVSYAVGYTCGSTQTMSGRSIFTVFPHGLIVRADQVVPAREAVSNPISCRGCNNSTGSMFPPSLQSYWSFEGKGMPVIARVSGERCGRLPSTRTVGVRWFADDLGGAVEPSVPGATVFEYKFTPNPGAAIAPVQRVSRSAVVVVPRDSCDDVFAQLETPSIVVEKDGEQRALVLGDDFIYSDVSGHAGRFALRAADGGAVPPFAVRLAVGKLAHLRVRTGSDDAQVAYLHQYTAEGESLFWFEGGIPAGDSIVVEVL